MTRSWGYALLTLVSGCGGCGGGGGAMPDAPVAIDSATPVSVQAGETTSLDTAHEHTIVFTCSPDLCIPDRKTIAVGTKDESLTVDMRFRPAVLVVNGEPGKSYAIVEYPGITVTVGLGVNVPPTSGADFDVTVKELGSDRSKKTITLRPGQSSTVSFP